MPKGGARARSGPAPDPLALRRERPSDAAGWTTLPAAGRVGVVPRWPLSKALARELVLWRREWRRAQAVMWEANGQELEVALYVRAVVVAERPLARAADRVLVRQLQEALGLSLPGLARNRWRIGEEKPGVVAAGAGRRAPSARGRFRVVTGGGG